MKKLLSKLICVGLAVFLIFGLVGCDSKKEVASGKMVAFLNDEYFYSTVDISENSSRIYKAKSDGSSKELLTKDEGALDDIYVYDGWVYYKLIKNFAYLDYQETMGINNDGVFPITNGVLKAVKADGSDQFSFNEEADQFVVTKDGVYFLQSGKILKMSHEGKDKEVVFGSEDGNVLFFAIQDDYVYFHFVEKKLGDKCGIYRMKLVEEDKDTAPEKLIENNCNYFGFEGNKVTINDKFYIVDDWIVFMNDKDNKKEESKGVFKMKTDGSQMKTIKEYRDTDEEHIYLTDLKVLGNKIYWTYNDSFEENGMDGISFDWGYDYRLVYSSIAEKELYVSDLDGNSAMVLDADSDNLVETSNIFKYNKRISFVNGYDVVLDFDKGSEFIELYDKEGNLALTLD